MVALVVHIDVKAEYLSQYLELCKGMLAPSQAEDACISYDFFAKPENPNHVVFVEEWESAAGLEAHFEMDHFQKFVADTEPMTNSVNLRQYEVASFKDF